MLHQGGLGLKNLYFWNEVLMIKHLWNIAAKKDTLWVKWISIEKLKGRCIWEVQCDSKSSVGWKNILSLRDKVRGHIGWKIGDGKSVNVWYDKWCPASPLNRVKDKAIWISNNGIEKCFIVSNVWKDLNCNAIKVDWYQLVWFTQSIPRHAFVTWLAIQKRLMTQDKLLLWKPNEDLKCALCKKCPDSHNHLFFTCELSNEVWKDLLSLLNVRLSSSWDQIISEMKAIPLNKNIWSIVRRLVCSATVYYIWQERNNIIFKNKKRDKSAIFNIVKETVGMKLIGTKVKESKNCQRGGGDMEYQDAKKLEVLCLQNYVFVSWFCRILLCCISVLRRNVTDLSRQGSSVWHLKGKCFVLLKRTLQERIQVKNEMIPPSKDGSIYTTQSRVTNGLYYKGSYSTTFYKKLLGLP
ncbi:RNA-directed DNA polymerase, eukaryota, reverse transcriptase zinc-binding domain protein [Tanacetum coccineum]